MRLCDDAHTNTIALSPLCCSARPHCRCFASSAEANIGLTVLTLGSAEGDRDRGWGGEKLKAGEMDETLEASEGKQGNGEESAVRNVKEGEKEVEEEKRGGGGGCRC